MGCIIKDLFDLFESLLEQINVEFLKLCPCERFREVLTINKTLNLKSGLVGRGEGTLCLFDLSTKLLNCPVVRSDILAHLLLDQLDEVVHHSLVKVLTTLRPAM